MNGFEPGSSGVGVDHSANFTPFGVLFEEFCVSTPPPQSSAHKYSLWSIAFDVLTSILTYFTFILTS